jgi:UDP-N-acetylglucosamine--N-acetylmuramyl-(pentapeptide) pyrophosphoryl-undecaprenol N-acetylglucosamine transferase
VHGRIRPSAQHRQAAIARILLTGGGTGGHVYPALAIAEALGDRPVRHDLLFVGSPDGLENAIVPKAGLPMAHVAARPLARKPSLDTLRTVAENAVGVAQALRVVAAFRPDCVVATGGYVTFPVVLAARALRPLRGGRPRIALLEPNAVAGLTNRLVAPLADEQWVAHPAARPATNVVVTGTPVRASILRAVPQAQARAALGLDAATTTIVVMGGSQGARRINDAVAALIAGGEERGWQILHLSGERDYDRARAAAASARMPVRVFAYLDDPAVAYAAADLVVARAGASTLAELAATATPALLVPYPYATDDHQARNAEAVAAAGAARVVADAELDGERLASELTAALEPGVYGRLRACARALAAADARTLIVERIEALAARG